MLTETPEDYLNPNWNKAQKIHEWKNYISKEVQLIWHSFTDEQKAALARQAEDDASNEEWI